MMIIRALAATGDNTSNSYLGVNDADTLSPRFDDFNYEPGALVSAESAGIPARSGARQGAKY
jgi:hypothetical protein